MFLDDMEFGFDGGSRGPSKINRKNWIGAAITAGAAVVGALAGGDDGGKSSDSGAYKVRDKTESSTGLQNMEMFFDENAEQALKNLSDTLGSWAEQDQAFFQEVWQPFQQELITTNANMLPIIEQTSADALEAISRDMVENDTLKDAFRSSIALGDTTMTDTLNSLLTEIDNIPSVEQRVGEALASVEGNFGRAGKELARSMAEQGRAVSQSSERDLAIEKAKAKSGASSLAAEQARLEKQQALQAGLGAIAGVQEQRIGGLATTTAAGQKSQELGLGAVGQQVGGVTAAQDGTGKAGIQADLVTQAATKVLGTENVNKSADFTQKGIKNPAASGIDIETGGFSQEWKDEQQAALEAERAHELEMERLRNQRKSSQSKTIDGYGGPGVGGADSGDTGGIDGGVGNGGGGESPGAGNIGSV